MVLNKGLGFVYTETNTNHLRRNLDLIDNFERKLQIKLFFLNKEDKLSKTNKNITTPVKDNNNSNKIKPIKIVSNWQPPKPNPSINAFCNKLKYEIKQISRNYKNTPNLSIKEHKALQNLRKNNKITIKPADKGGGIVILDTINYEEKILTYLDNNSIYSIVSMDLLEKDNLIQKYQTLIHDLKPYLNKRQFNWLLNIKDDPGKIYSLPKLHKTGNPIRPIIAQCTSLTSKLHNYIQQLLKIGELQIPNLIKYTTDFLNKLGNYKNQINENTILVTLDVESLYTNIPIDLGINFITEHYLNTLKYWNLYEIDVKPIPITLLKKILEFALKNCYFTFNGTLCQKMQGLTMGGAGSVQVANIVMYKFFQNFTNSHPSLIWDHVRFIDDLFGIWNKSSDELDRYFNTLNTFHPNFKFTINRSKHDIPFLDVKVSIINNTFNTFKTNIYTKPTDKKTIFKLY